MQITFTQEKETKRTFRYKETAHDGKPIEEDAAIIGSIYVRKSAAAARPEITIDFPLADQ